MPTLLRAPRLIPRRNATCLAMHTSSMTGILAASPVLMAALRRAAALGLPHWYVGGGAVAQTVWNALTGRDPLHGIRDFDLVYHDGADLSWAAEDAVIRRGAEVFAGL